MTPHTQLPPTAPRPRPDAPTADDIELMAYALGDLLRGHSAGAETLRAAIVDVAQDALNEHTAEWHESTQDTETECATCGSSAEWRLSVHYCPNCHTTQTTYAPGYAGYVPDGTQATAAHESTRPDMPYVPLASLPQPFGPYSAAHMLHLLATDDGLRAALCGVSFRTEDGGESRYRLTGTDTTQEVTGGATVTRTAVVSGTFTDADGNVTKL